MRKDVERSVSVAGFIVNKRYCAYRIGGKSGEMHRPDPNPVDDAIKVHRQLLARGVIPASSLSLFIAALFLAIASELKRKRWHALVNIVVYRERRKSLFVHK